MKNSHVLIIYYAKSKYTWNKILIKNLFLRDSQRKSRVGKMNGTATGQREITPAK